MGFLKNLFNFSEARELKRLVSEKTERIFTLEQFIKSIASELAAAKSALAQQQQASRQQSAEIDRLKKHHDSDRAKILDLKAQIESIQESSDQRVRTVRELRRTLKIATDSQEYSLTRHES